MSAGGLELVPTGVDVLAADLLALKRYASVAARLFDMQLALVDTGVMRLRGQGMEYAESRLYSPGDDVRRMDRRVTARTGKPHTKVFRPEQARELMVVVDLRHTMHFGTKCAFKSVVAATGAVLAGWAMAESDDRLGVVIAGAGIEVVPPGPASASLPLICQALEQSAVRSHAAQPDTEPSIVEVAERTVSVASPGSTTVLFSDLHDRIEQVEAALQLLTRGGAAFVAWTLDAFEFSLPALGRIDVASKRLVRNVDTSAKAARDAHKAFLVERDRRLRQFARQPGAIYRRVLTGNDLLRDLARSPEAVEAAAESSDVHAWRAGLSRMSGAGTQDA